MFCQKNKLDVFFPAKKSIDDRWEVVGVGHVAVELDLCQTFLAVSDSWEKASA
jgi:hypothetical protein